jgi:hypothetical protein
LKDNAASSRTGVEIDQDNLLPGAQQQSPIAKRDGQGGLAKSGSSMGEAVAVSPAAVVLIIQVPGDQALEGFFQKEGRCSFHSVKPIQ